jgi:hypothetical protein
VTRRVIKTRERLPGGVLPHDQFLSPVSICAPLVRPMSVDSSDVSLIRELAMKYMLLIYDAEQVLAKMSAEEGQRFHDEYMKFTAEIRQSGHLVGGDALESVRTATTVRIRESKTTTTDGPFAETREQLGGYYLIEAKDLDEALKIAARVPSARTGSIEVRPLVTTYDKPLTYQQ